MPVLVPPKEGAGAHPEEDEHEGPGEGEQETAQVLSFRSVPMRPLGSGHCSVGLHMD